MSSPLALSVAALKDDSHHRREKLSASTAGGSMSAAEEAEVKRVLFEADVQKASSAPPSKRKTGIRNRLFSMQQHGGMIAPRIVHNKGKSRRPPGLKALFSFLDLRQRGAMTNPSDFGATHVARTLQHELSKEASSTQLAENTWPFVKQRRKMVKGVSPPPRHSLTTGEKEYYVGEQLPPEAARHILISTTWRSGSSFFGEVLAQYPGAYYSYEPLHATYFQRQFDNDTLRADALRLTSSLFRCDYDDGVLRYLRHASKGRNNFLWQNNFRVWKACQNLLPAKAACFLPLFYKQTCPLFPVRVIKTVRMRVLETAALLDDPRLANLKIVVLVRDPRGVMNSRSAMEWCKNDQCANVDVICEHLR